jgi:hypothetical protein
LTVCHGEPATTAAPPLKVIPIADYPPLNDVPARLRHLAERIEAGDHGKIESVVLMLLPWETFTPIPLCFGDTMNRHRMAGVLTHAAHLALTDKD